MKPGAGKLDPRRAESYNYRGVARLFINDADEAQRDFDHCLAVDKNLKEKLVSLIAEAAQQLAGRGHDR